MAELAGKKALVVGGSRGIGAGAASGLASNGADVAITYSGSKDKAHSVVRDIEASGVRGAALPLDGMDADSARVAVDEAADRLGGLDILVNCAGIFPYGLIEDVTLERDLARFKRTVAQRWGELVYDGLWFSPLKDSLDAFIADSQQHVSGDIRMSLHGGRAVVNGRRSEQSLYDFNLATYDEGDTFDQGLAKGFVQLWGLPSKIAAKRDQG